MRRTYRKFIDFCHKGKGNVRVLGIVTFIALFINRNYASIEGMKYRRYVKNGTITQVSGMRIRVYV